MKTLKFQLFGVGGKAWTLLSKKEQRQLKQQRNKDLRITEPIRRVAKRILSSKFGEGFEELEDSKDFNSKNLDLGLVDSLLFACFET
ncbi:hypothetical protein MTR67_030983 [Solanum verrucosum]|uniref:Uncharacterized protein n=1 Tax=Solanum verrucosum TaxID=315347 RepID=A0AAF0U1M0_SOLVR|nr:hypothetical protein MTR67_030983 [Solanum verrucosum]